MTKFFKHGGTIAWLLILGIMLAIALSVKLFTDTMELRYQRDVNRMVFNDNLGVLEDIRAKLGIESDNMRKMLESAPADTGAPYLVVSISENKLWYKKGDSVLFETRVATASGKTLVGKGSGQRWRFETPRGKLTVTEKEENPAWVPPDWHFIEQAHKRGLGLVNMSRGQQLKGSDGSVYYAQGANLVRQHPDGTTEPVKPPEEGRELVVNGSIVIPPFGTNQRRYMGVLGTRRLKMPDGYAIHGTNNPSSIGQSVSHGCIRMLNEDIERLYPIVPVGTVVYIY